ncbi:MULTISPECIES: phosphatase PAP2 family protein [Tatumella]|uniref:Phosphatase PAP2 family protein n=1 Tax=Tatumella punctata TaxID=399969 RepID=A0ABW1VM90_9GAMM|nr:MULTISPECIES: phosphatase PAP2 family protein [unclassified Tatumella]MBS0854789.1 phosphatase PAP2 family protein [Tatumella sp. JGM16]MBS0878433.1 phosphatase PAP2 family protein [Tatumella sp. JGM82]MBS0892009.1 phosphatase PAP2 family protein [Tatumella sp. JGM94]MBS0892944.1 phosphatase PAP2 family protein [Tatumella sp. JGM130]MBS0903127.1 phosphatase PAP2 family protein [Tatumella sp. JGM100]
MYWKNLTYFGDSMLLLPTAVLIAIFLLWKSGRWQTAFGWLVTFGSAGMIVSISKVMFMGFFLGSKTYNFTGFSGHTTMSSTFWPVFMWLISAQWPLVRRRCLIIAGYLLPLAIGFSRLQLHAHSPSEVITGAILGLSLSSLFLFVQRHTALKAIPLTQLALFACLPAVILLQGQPATTQQFLAKLSARLAGIEKPFTRAELLHSGTTN